MLVIVYTFILMILLFTDIYCNDDNYDYDEFLR